jgi:hypothetical protein
MRHAKQFVDALGNSKQTAVIIGEGNVAWFDLKGTKACRLQR